jgi:uracil-DNA glycosylase
VNPGSPQRPKALREACNRQRRRGHLRTPHVAPLTDLVERIRRETGYEEEVPYFDPFDAGIHAECMFIQQAPGPGAIASGFVSRDNDDESARHFFELARDAGLDRERTITWNAVPWHMDGAKINEDDLEEGLAYLDEALSLLPDLRALVMLGEKAQKLDRRLFRLRPRLKRFAAPLPSPQFINRKAEHRQRILDVFSQVREHLGAPGAP